jgi:hypothetical protein
MGKKKTKKRKKALKKFLLTDIPITVTIDFPPTGGELHLRSQVAFGKVSDYPTGTTFTAVLVHDTPHTIPGTSSPPPDGEQWAFQFYLPKNGIVNTYDLTVTATPPPGSGYSAGHDTTTGITLYND